MPSKTSLSFGRITSVVAKVTSAIFLGYGFRKLLITYTKKTYFQVISHRESRERILMDIHLLLEFTLYYIRPRQKMLMYLWISYAAILSKIDLFIMA